MLIDQVKAVELSLYELEMMSDPYTFLKEKFPNQKINGQVRSQTCPIALYLKSKHDGKFAVTMSYVCFVPTEGNYTHINMPSKLSDVVIRFDLDIGLIK